MNFPDALTECLNGKRIRNKAWNGKNMYVYAVEGRTYKKVKTLPYLMMFNAKEEFVPWLISQMDVFSKDWVVVE